VRHDVRSVELLSRATAAGGLRVVDALAGYELRDGPAPSSSACPARGGARTP
jgi:hypothetical protein